MKFNAFAQNFVFNLTICFKDTESAISDINTKCFLIRRDIQLSSGLERGLDIKFYQKQSFC